MLRIAGRALILMALANSTSFWFASAALGGDALNGKIEDGPYYVAEHGKYTQVSEVQFRYSAWHTRSILVTHALGAVGMLLLYAIGDPFVTQRNARRDRWVLGVMGASILLGMAGGRSDAWLPLLVFPVAILAAVLLDLRDASAGAPGQVS